jgi:hypothetical protein
MNKLIIVWLVLLTGWVGIQEWQQYTNLQISNSNTQIRKQRYEEIVNGFESVQEVMDERFAGLEEYINGPLREQLEWVGERAHEH